MNNRVDLLLLESVVSACADCGGERIFVPVDDDCGGGACEFCCTTCGAAILIDPLISIPDSQGARTASRSSNPAKSARLRVYSVAS